MIVDTMDAVMPPEVSRIVAVRACSGSEFVTTHSPVLKVDVSPVAGALTLDMQWLSTVASSLKPGEYHAFVAVDGQVVVLTIAAGERLRLTFAGLSPGVHSVHYGVYIGTKLAQHLYACPTVPALSEASGS